MRCSFYSGKSRFILCSVQANRHKPKQHALSSITILFNRNNRNGVKIRKEMPQWIHKQHGIALLFTPGYEQRTDNVLGDSFTETFWSINQEQPTAIILQSIHRRSAKTTASHFHDRFHPFPNDFHLIFIRSFVRCLWTGQRRSFSKNWDNSLPCHTHTHQQGIINFNKDFVAFLISILRIIIINSQCD